MASLMYILKHKNSIYCLWIYSMGKSTAAKMHGTDIHQDVCGDFRMVTPLQKVGGRSKKRKNVALNISLHFNSF